MLMNRRGFISLPFLVVFSFCISLCAYLSLKSKKETFMMIDLMDVNHQIQREYQIVQEVLCLIQCNPQDQFIELGDESIWIEFEENVAFAEDLVIEFDEETHQILAVHVE